MASIQSTVHPPEPLPLIEWLQFIGHLKGNKVRPGGIAYQDIPNELERIKKQLRITSES